MFGLKELNTLRPITNSTISVHLYFIRPFGTLMRLRYQVTARTNNFVNPGIVALRI